MKNYINGLQHIGIPTVCYEETVDFYEILGFKNIYETKQKDSNQRVSFLQLGSLTMEVYDTVESAQCDGAINHIALNCIDIEKEYEIIQKLGFKVITESIMHLPYWEKGIKFFVIKGPNDEAVEFCQIL